MLHSFIFFSQQKFFQCWPCANTPLAASKYSFVNLFNEHQYIWQAKQMFLLHCIHSRTWMQRQISWMLDVNVKTNSSVGWSWTVSVPLPSLTSSDNYTPALPRVQGKKTFLSHLYISFDLRLFCFKIIYAFIFLFQESSIVKFELFHLWVMENLFILHVQ